MEPNVSNNFCLGHKSTQVCRLHGKRPSAERENLFSGYKSSERAKFCCQQPRSTIKLIDGHRDFGAAKLPEI
jgi:hypothetical protein